MIVAPYQFNILLDLSPGAAPGSLEHTPGQLGIALRLRDNDPALIKGNNKFVALLDGQGLTDLLGDNELAFLAESYRFVHHHTIDSLI